MVKRLATANQKKQKQNPQLPLTADQYLSTMHNRMTKQFSVQNIPIGCVQFILSNETFVFDRSIRPYTHYIHRRLFECLNLNFNELEICQYIYAVLQHI